MEQILITKKNGSTEPIFQNSTVSVITKAEQKKALLGEDVINITVESAFTRNFEIGDKIKPFDGNTYKINQLPRVTKISENQYQYDLVFEGLQYDLIRCAYRNEDVLAVSTNSEFSLVGDIQMFLDLIINNANRVFGTGVWELGTVPTGTDTKTLQFSNENCLTVLQRICQEYNYHFVLRESTNKIIIDIKSSGTDLNYTFKYGKGKGLYQLTREKVDSKNIINTLYVYGSTKNIPADYKNYSPRLRLGLAISEPVLSVNDSVTAFGTFEGSVIFEDVYPHRVGTVSTIDTNNRYKFIDSSMDFDLNEVDGSNNTKWLISGVPAKIHFNTGNLAGYEFEIEQYTHSTKTFIIKPINDNKGLELPSTTESAFFIGVGDKYVIVDVVMPSTYVSAAEAELEAKANEFLDKNKNPIVQYSLNIDSNYLKSNSVGLNIFEVGDTIEIIDSELNINNRIEIIGFSRDILKPYEYSLTIGESIENGIIRTLTKNAVDVNRKIKFDTLDIKGGTNPSIINQINSQIDVTFGSEKPIKIGRKTVDIEFGNYDSINKYFGEQRWYNNTGLFYSKISNEGLDKNVEVKIPTTLASFTVASVENSWQLGGNTVGSEKSIGTIDNYDLPIIRNNTQVAKFVSGGLQLPTISTLGTTLSQFAVIGASNLIQQRSISNVRADLFGGSFTSGSVIFSNGTTLAQNNSQLFWDNTNNRFGIGTTSPTEKLDVNGSIKVVNGGKFIGQASSWYNGGQVLIDYATQGRIQAYDGTLSQNKDLLLQWNGGNVGIGTFVPSYKLDVNGTIATTGFRYTTGAATGYILQSDASGNASWVAPSTLASIYKGTWDASTNIPSLANGTGTAGWWYRCVVAGTVNFGAGSITFAVGDDVYYNGSIWQRIPFSYQLVKASTSILGGVIVGSTMQVDTNGIINLGSITQGSGSNFVKITLDGYGRVTGNTAVTASDIPSLDWSKITTGKPTTLSGYGITNISGTNKYFARFTGSDTIGNSSIYIDDSSGTTANIMIDQPDIAKPMTVFISGGLVVNGNVAASGFTISSTILETNNLRFNGNGGTDGQFLMSKGTGTSGATRPQWTTLGISNITNLQTSLDAKQNNITTVGVLLGSGSALSGLSSSTAGQILRRNTANNGYEFATLTSTDLPSHTHTFASLTSKPTTISGYGITDFNSTWDARWETTRKAFVYFEHSVEIAQSLTVNTDLYAYKKIYDSELSEGTSGQYLSSTGIGTKWINGQDNWGQKQTHTQYDTLSDITTSAKWGAYFVNGTTTDLPNSIQQGHVIKLGIGSDYSSQYTLMSFGRPFSTHFDGKLYVRGVYGASDSGWLPIGLNYSESLEGGVGLSFYGDLAQTYETARIETHTDSGVVDFVAYYLDSNNDRKKMGIRLNLNNNLPWFFNEETEFPLISEGGGGNNISYSFDANYFTNSNNYISLKQSFIDSKQDVSSILTSIVNGFAAASDGTVLKKSGSGFIYGTDNVGSGGGTTYTFNTTDYFSVTSNYVDLKSSFVSLINSKLSDGGNVSNFLNFNSNAGLIFGKTSESANAALMFFDPTSDTVQFISQKTIEISTYVSKEIKLKSSTIKVNYETGGGDTYIGNSSNYLHLNGRKYYFDSVLIDSASTGSKFCFEKLSDGKMVISAL